MATILVLGITGMLGSMVYDYFKNHTQHKVYGTVRNENYLAENVFLFDALNIEMLETEEIKNKNIDYIINAIGITKPFSKDDDREGVKRGIRINADFPWKLDEYAIKNNIKILQIGTDCVYSGKDGMYTEKSTHDPLDVYGKSKSLGEVFGGNTLIIRSSIIGPEYKKQTTFLLEWFLNQPNGGTIGGFEHHKWNGVTTLQFAKMCEIIIDKNIFDPLTAISYVHHFIPNSTVNKYELMNIFNDVFQKGLIIDKINRPGQEVDRTIDTEFHELEKYYKKGSMKEAISEVRDYMNSSKMF